MDAKEGEFFFCIARRGVVWRSVSLGRLSRYTRKLNLRKDRMRGLGLSRHAA